MQTKFYECCEYRDISANLNNILFETIYRTIFQDICLVRDIVRCYSVRYRYCSVFIVAAQRDIVAINSLRSMPLHWTVYVTLTCISDSSLDFRAPDPIHFPCCLASLLDHFLHPKLLLKRLEIVWFPSEMDHDLFTSDAICNLNLAVFENLSCKTHWKVPVQTRQGN